MKAMVLRSYGGPSALHLEERPTPEPGPGQLLVRVRAASVNPIDLKLASGKFWPILRAHFPHVPGFDLAGEVVRCGSGVSGFTAGSRVHARLLESGATAEYALSTPDVTTLMAPELDFASAAGLPLAGMTALQGLRDVGGMPMVGATLRVLVVGASGGVGHFAVQLAKAAGAHVSAVCSAHNRALVERLGAHDVFDYAAADPFSALAPCDLIFDCVGQSAAKWLPFLRPGGVFVTVVPGPDAMLRGVLNPFTNKKVRPVLLKPNAADLALLGAMHAAGTLRVTIDQRFPLAQTNLAWERSATGRAAGKIIIDVA